MLVALRFELVWGFVPQAGAVSLAQYGAVGVPIVSPATWRRGTEPGR